MTVEALTEKVTYLGRIAIWCGNQKSTTIPVCIVRTFTGEKDPDLDLIKTIKVY